MVAVTHKTALTTIDGTPEKRIFLSIISDYDLRTGICELIDNALDLWIENDKKPNVTIEVTLDPNRQFIQVRVDAGGIGIDEARLLIAPGATRNGSGKPHIGIFGVGGKRAGVALGELVEIRTRHKKEKSIEVDITNEWLRDAGDWNLEICEIPDIDPSTTTVDISKVRQSFDEEDVEGIRQHLGETYSWFINEGSCLKLNGQQVEPITFDAWAYPPDYLPRQAAFRISPTSDGSLDVTLTAGLILDRDPEAENYGVYFFCNHRLIVKELRTRDVGYVSGEAGVPHPDASLCRVLVDLSGAAELMPWNSSKSGLNFSDAAFLQLRPRIIDFLSYYTTLSRRLKSDWEGNVFRHKTGTMERVEPTDALSTKKRILPKIPSSKRPSRIEQLKASNKTLLRDAPWTLGLVESMGLVDLISRQKLETKNRAALILLDSNFEIALKEYIVNRKDLFPAYKYTNVTLATLFGNRTNVIKEVQAHAKFSKTLLGKVDYYYNLRNALMHQRASVLITDTQVEDYRVIIERVLKKLFGIKFPSE